MGVHLSETLAFLFTDIEGSTRRWEAEPDLMEAALVAHDAVLRSAITAHAGFLFKHTGDGVCAAFASLEAAIGAAVDAQRRLGLPVRMGVGAGPAHHRDGDYFGPALNRTARVMAAGHGGQILVAASSPIDGVDLVDLGEHMLRDVPGAVRLFQVRADGLARDFPPLRTAVVAPGNLPVQDTSFVGRDGDAAALVDAVRAHRLVTLTGMGGVGKTRLALHVGAQLAAEFPEGVWLVELAPVSDPAAVAEVVASTLQVSHEPGVALTDSIARALSQRRSLLVLDNCEHVIDAAADLVDVILSAAPTAQILTTSRQPLGAAGEQLWPVPPLSVQSGLASPAVELFLERARAVVPGYQPVTAGEADAVIEVCRRLDGLALAIELAAARMVSMSAAELQDRLADRFRLLSSRHRGSQRHHQTLRQAIAWSVDLLDDDERAVLAACSVFRDGFDLAAAAYVCDIDGDDYAVLDVVESLVRKSLIIVELRSRPTRYAMLETIRQFVGGQPGLHAVIEAARGRHLRYFADGAVRHWQRWSGGAHRQAVDWVDVEMANLRAAFWSAAERDELDDAATIASFTTLLAFPLQRLEPVGWAEDLLERAANAEVRRLPRLYSAASLCTYTGRPADGVRYAETALALEANPAADSFEAGWSAFFAAIGHRFCGRVERYVEICSSLIEQPGVARVIGLCSMLFILPALGRDSDAVAIADETVGAARATANPFLVAWALNGYGRTYTETDPERALQALRSGFQVCREHRIPFWEANIARDSAGLEALHGQLCQALEMFDTTIESLHRIGNTAHLAATMVNLAGLFDRIGDPGVAATLYGTTMSHAATNMVINLTGTVERVRDLLGDAAFDRCVAEGAAMASGDAVRYARHHIELARTAAAT